MRRTSIVVAEILPTSVDLKLSRLLNRRVGSDVDDGLTYIFFPSDHEQEVRQWLEDKGYTVLVDPQES